MVVTAQKQKRAVGVFSKRQQAEQALNELKASGFSMEKVSIVAKDTKESDRLSDAEITDHVGDENVGVATGVVGDTLSGSFWGSVLLGLTSLSLPGLGAVLAAGSLGVALATSIGGVAVGAAATQNVVKALGDIGIPEEKARHYSDRLHQGDYLVIVECTDDDIQNVEAVLTKHKIELWGVYDSPQA